jgi:hypothetical protein
MERGATTETLKIREALQNSEENERNIVDRPSFLAFIASVRVIMVEAWFSRLQGTEVGTEVGTATVTKCQEIWVSCRRQRGSRWCCLYDSFRNYLTHAAWPAENAKPWSNVCSKHHRNVTKCHKALRRFTPRHPTCDPECPIQHSIWPLRLQLILCCHVLSLVIQYFLLVLWQPSELTVWRGLEKLQLKRFQNPTATSKGSS